MSQSAPMSKTTASNGGIRASLAGERIGNHPTELTMPDDFDRSRATLWGVRALPRSGLAPLDANTCRRHKVGWSE
jgi:hypothetical protein